MKFSNQSLETLLGVHKKPRRKWKEINRLEQSFENPIIHREVNGDRVYVPLNLDRVWNGI